jgi:serine protease AprX
MMITFPTPLEVVLKSTKRIIFFGLALILIATLASPAALSTPASQVKAQPQLIQLGTERPAQMVKVIVQQAAGAAGLQSTVARLGGTLTLDLPIIHSFAANLPASAALELASRPDVRWVSLDAPVESAGVQNVSTTNLVNAYDYAIRADKVWNSSANIQGKGVGVAVIDSGVNPSGDLYSISGANRLVANVRFNTDYNQSPNDGFGHGTHVSSIIAGNGSTSNGKYIGVAPLVNLINVKVSNDDGAATTATIVAGLQWVLNNKNTYNIRVVNLSLNSSVDESYKTSPLDAAVEILWFNKIVVVVSAGNQGANKLYPPANDPFVITVGAVDDKGTPSLADDSIPSFSAFGTTKDGFAKPDLTAPGVNIVAKIVNQTMGLTAAHPDHKMSDAQYFRMSGTSMAAPMVSGAAALLLQDEPGLTPDQVKYRLTSTANKTWAGYNASKAGAGYLDAYAAVTGASTQNANTGLTASTLLTTGTQPITSTVSWNSVSWNSVSWNSVSWNSVSWNSVSWNSVSWNSVSWNSDYWGN